MKTTFTASSGIAGYVQNQGVHSRSEGGRSSSSNGQVPMDSFLAPPKLKSKADSVPPRNDVLGGLTETDAKPTSGSAGGSSSGSSKQQKLVQILRKMEALANEAIGLPHAEAQAIEKQIKSLQKEYDRLLKS